MMNFFAGLIGKATGPMLVYVLAGLIAANATTGYLLKSAWKKNAQAVLQCENQSLRDANEANEATTAQLLKSQAEFAAYREEIRKLTATVEKENAKAMREMETEHRTALIDLEVATNEIPDEDYYCATEPVSDPVLARMRDTATTYNENKGGDGHGGSDP